ncbi:hypothetical protein HK414_02635 [Ramlibacter terrae]|uniref:DUF1631 family protein n=1 Tax=Ramlibacter terrae TaxID=2732511 RepID=A0ABX6P072_9BURK|nr:hypothetical protein HK414_02635 [Ramlibacter terrae]
MTTIDPGQRLAAAVHSEVAALRERTAARTQSQGKPAARRQGTEGLASVVAQRVAGIAADDPQRRQKAFRAFLETALLHELGSTLIHDAAFPTLVDAVQSRLQADAQLARAAEELAGYLLAPSPK